MSDSDDESDDELLNFGLIHSSSSSSSSDCNANTISSISVAGQKRERKQTTRLVDEGKAEKSIEYNLERLMRASDRNTKKPSTFRLELRKVGNFCSFYTFRGHKNSVFCVAVLSEITFLSVLRLR